jgi:hypothetical protein
MPAWADVIIPIAPSQHFEGLVNNKTDHAVILTENCHRAPQGTYLIANPVPNQHVKAVLDPASDGFTGAAAQAINAQIPFSWPVPCNGPGQVRFTPSPNNGGVTETVDVTFVNVPPPSLT